MTLKFYFLKKIEKVFIFLENKIKIDIRYFLKNGSWIFFRQIIVICCNFAVIVIFTRFATQEIYGEYQFILAVFGILSIFSLPGFNAAIVKVAAKGIHGNYKESIHLSFIWCFLAIPVSFLIGCYFLYLENVTLAVTLMICSILSPFFYGLNSWEFFLQGQSKFSLVAKYSIVQAIVNALATIIVLLIQQNNIILISIVYFFSNSLFNIFYYLKSLKYVNNQKKSNSIIKYGFFLTKINIIGIIAAHIDKICIGLFLSSSQLAIYSIGILFTSKLNEVSKSMLWVTVPKQIKSKILPRIIYVKLFIISTMVMLIGLFFIQLIIPLIFTEKYTSSIFLSIISMIFYPFFIVLIVYKDQIIFNENKIILTKESIITPIVKILLVIILLPVFKIAGLAFIYGFQYLLSLLILLYLDNKKTFSKPT